MFSKKDKLPELYSLWNFLFRKVFVNLHKYGNTSAASVAIALDEANREGCLKRGDNVALAGFGAGLTWASLVLKWY